MLNRAKEDLVTLVELSMVEQRYQAVREVLDTGATHETMHMTGLTSEADTECFATQRDGDMARALGAPRAAARSLAAAYWIGVYPQMPDPYRSGDCEGPAGSTAL